MSNKSFRKHIKEQLILILKDHFIYIGIILLVLSFAPFDLWYFTWIGIVFLFFSFAQTKNYTQAVVKGVWISVLYTLGGFYWISYAIHHFGKIPLPLSSILLLVFGLIAQLQFTFYSVFSFYLKSKKYSPFKTILISTSAYCVFDFFLPKIFSDSFGSNVYTSESFRQIVSLGGASFLTFLIFSFNYSLYYLVKLKKIQPRLLVFPVLTLLFFIYGYYENNEAQKKITSPEKTIKIAVIQGNIGDFDKLASRSGSRYAAQELLDIFFTLSDQALAKEPKLDFIVWPETTYPGSFRKPFSSFDNDLDQRIENYVQNRNTSLLFGGYDHIDGKDYNALNFLTPSSLSQNDLQVYQKSLLLPFGEYIPILDHFDFVKKLFPQMGFFGRGPGPTVYEVRSSQNQSARFLPIICYEALFESFTREGSKKNAEIILNVTNDSWFGPYAEPYQHLALSVFRGIETRLPQVRSTNTGISTLILQDGSMVKPSTIGAREFLIYDVPVVSFGETIYVKFGWLFPYLLALFLLGFFLRVRLRKKH